MRLLSHNSNRLWTQVSHSCLRSITSQRKLKHTVETSTTTTHNQKPPATQQQLLDLDLVYPNLVAHIVRRHLVIKLAKLVYKKLQIWNPWSSTSLKKSEANPTASFSCFLNYRKPWTIIVCARVQETQTPKSPGESPVCLVPSRWTCS